MQKGNSAAGFIIAASVLVPGAIDQEEISCG